MGRRDARDDAWERKRDAVECGEIGLKNLIIYHKFEEAFNTLSQHWPLPVNEINNLIQTIQSVNRISERYGKAESFIKFHSKTYRFP